MSITTFQMRKLSHSEIKRLSCLLCSQSQGAVGIYQGLLGLGPFWREAGRVGISRMFWGLIGWA